MTGEYGYFSKDGREYVITNPRTPRHWYNYLWNDDYITFTSQVGYGEGFAQDDMGRRIMPVSNRYLFLVDTADNSYWAANNPMVGAGAEGYACTHGIGVATIRQDHDGSVYLHACTWKLAADAILKRADRVQEGLEKMLPTNDKWAAKHAEPYIMCNSYFPAEAGYREGSPGQSWRTGTGAWFLKDIAFYALGLQPEMEGLRLNPCLPPDWKSCSVRKRFRRAEYEIYYEQPEHSDGVTINEITVNGEPLEGDVLPWKEGGCYDVRVKVGRR